MPCNTKAKIIFPILPHWLRGRILVEQPAFFCYDIRMFIDEAIITVRAGNGGSGKVSFDTSKGGRGPNGGSGGIGGDVYAEAVSDLGALRQFRHKKLFAAENGKDGRGKFLDGAGGEDIVLKVPVGTVIRKTGVKYASELLRPGERALLARGGKGGRGNFLFRGPRNTSPKEFEHGRIGEEFELFLELQLIADAGFIGLPNVGKSSLLNELTAARVKVANYPFTTLDPNLGVLMLPQGAIILADIPGLIEGAAAGKGLGHKFLRHIARTKVLLHCISADAGDPLRDYATVREELARYDKALAAKDEYIIITRRDLVSEAILAEKTAALQKKNPRVIAVSIYDLDAIEKLKNLLASFVSVSTV